MFKKNISRLITGFMPAVILLTVFLTPSALPAEETTSFESFSSQDGIFSVAVPQNWPRSEDFYFHEDGEYGLKLYAPRAVDLSYVLMEFVCYGTEYKTAEKFIYQKMHPHMKAKGEERGPVKDVSIAGRPAKTFTVKTVRSLVAGLDTAEVKVARKYVVFPFSSGFGVALCDAPLDQADKYEPIFDKMVLSFKPLKHNIQLPNEGEVEEEEYRVFTDFLKIENNYIPAAEEASLSAEEKAYRLLLKGFDFPSEGAGGIVVSQMTANNRRLDKRIATALKISDAAIIDDYEAKNKNTYKLKDKFLVEKDVAILTEERAKNIFTSRGGWMEFHKKYPFASGLIYLSRIGFNKDKTLAVFYVANPVDSEMGKGYMVLMEKNKGGWRLVHFINLWMA
jgi:hypothetical protein